MNCVICKKPILPDRDDKGKIYWTQGNNSLPVQEGRCCNACNFTKVIPARINRIGKLKKELDSRKIENHKEAQNEA
jgi:hypothetical protein|tara:strand:- start:320 stop:547 length:228 start_codon:yes stop_codon:yes gene_type:complete